ncbi:MAG: hypothetical protein IPL83_02510 [Bdellovibrionales bacterium]|nr:hypothetical protein [Bdellovibrionales bacterium]
MSQQSLSANDFYAFLRPLRNVFLVPHDLPTPFILDHILPWTSSHWSGANQFFFPIFPQGDAHPDFDRWLRLLKKYDPDFVVSIGNFPNTLLDTILSHTSSKTEWFQFNAQTVTTPNMIHRGFHGMKIEDVIGASISTLTLDEFPLTGSADHDIWFFSQFGRFGRHSANCAGQKIIVNQAQITPQQIEQSAREIAYSRFGNNFSASPLLHSLEFLGGRWAAGPQVDYFLPYFVVIGDSTADWALFTSLKYLYDGVFWIKPSMLAANQTGFPGDFEHLLHHILSDDSRQDDAYVISASLPQAQVETLVNGVLGWIGQTYSGFRNGRFRYFSDFDDLANWKELAEINNSTESSLIFEEKKSVQRVPIVGPKHFKPTATTAKFMSVLVSDSYSYLSHPLTDAPTAAWKNPRAILTGDIRRSCDGGVSFNSVQHLIYGSQDIDSVQHGPKLIKPSIFDDFTSILSKFSLRPRKTIKTLNVSSVLDLWGSTENFSDDFFRRDTKRIFEVFRMDKKTRAQQRNSIGLLNSSGLELAQKFYFSHPIAGAFTPALADLNEEKVDSWIEKGIILRGERLVCQRCGWADFYSEEEYSRQFTCDRCSAKWKRNLKTMGAIEPRFLYGLNPLIYGLFDNTSELTILGIDSLKKTAKWYLEAETEIEILDAQNKVIMEVDLIANLDGKFVIGECKVNGALNGNQLQSYVRFCKQVRADIFCSVSASPWNQQRIQSISGQFSSLHYRPELHFFSP